MHFFKHVGENLRSPMWKVVWYRGKTPFVLLNPHNHLPHPTSFLLQCFSHILPTASATFLAGEWKNHDRNIWGFQAQMFHYSLMKSSIKSIGNTGSSRRGAVVNESD